MHRSGTSVVSRLLNLHGVYLGPQDQFMKPADDNPRGFWENKRITDLNDEILARLGGSWHEPPLFRDRWETSPDLADLRQRARALLQEHFSSEKIWGWKDPRTCLTLPFWNRLLPPIQYVFSLRNPVDVARSLERRNKIPFKTGIGLWLQYVKSALDNSAGQRREFFFYEDIINDSRVESKRLATFLGKPDGAGQRKTQAQFRAYLAKELQHHRSNLIQSSDDPRFDFHAKALYIALRLYVSLKRREFGARDEVASAMEGALESLTTFGSRAREVFIAVQEELENLQKHTATLGRDLSERQQQVNEITEERNRLGQEVAQVQARLHAQHNLMKEKDEKINQLMAGCRTLDRENFELKATVQARQQSLLEQKKELNQSAIERERLLKELAELKTQITTQREMLEKKDEKLQKSLTDRERLEREVADLRIRDKMQQEMLTEKDTNLTQQENQRGLLHGKVEALESARKALTDHASELRAVVRSQQLHLDDKDKLIREFRAGQEKFLADSKTLKQSLEAEQSARWAAVTRAEAQQQELREITQSLAWLCVMKYRKFKDKVWPPGTRRRKTYDKLKNFSKDLIEHGPKRMTRRVWTRTRLSHLWDFLNRKSIVSIPLRVLHPIRLRSNTSDLSDGIRWIPNVRIDGTDKLGLFMHPASSVSYRFTVPRRAVFSGFAGLMPEVWGRNPGGVEFEFQASSCSSGRKLSRKMFVHPTRFKRDRRWKKFRVNLRSVSNEEIELVMATSVPTGVTADFAWAVWGTPVIYARKSFPEMLGRAKYNINLLGLKGFLSKMTSDGQSPSELDDHNSSMSVIESSGPPRVAEQPISSPSWAHDGIWKTEIESFISDTSKTLSFPSCDTPLASIVIPTFNKAEYLYQCLKSILSHTEVPFEVILVDDFSHDSTTALLKKLENVRVIRNERNLDFIRTCNKGAGFARARYILFLNNDVIVTPKWLSVLLSTIEQETDCGAVGAKLVRPDGTLQEAGSIIWRDGSAMGYGRDDDPLKPEYCYRREVDYCSAACLLVRADLFRDLGGFDERYLPAYYEDCDLCFGIRQRGYKVIYQPQVTIYHYEYGSRTAGSAISLMAENQKKLVEKWGRLLQEQQPYGNALKARDRRVGRRVLVIDDQIPAPYLGSGFPRAHKLVEFLNDLGWVVTFIPTANPTPHEPTTERLQQAGVEVFYGNSSVPEAVLRSRHGYYDAIVISRPHNGAKYLSLARECFPNARVIYDAEALFCLRDFLQGEIEGRPLSETQKRRMLKD
ncbi:MAG: glycosyltransferase, partial [Deltaproteobacteria bacterium]|nr:glycosyltransferase [Deltaproteobacteria bacterium]